jgi:hypothetical protein
MLGVHPPWKSPALVIGASYHMNIYLLSQFKNRQVLQEKSSRFSKNISDESFQTHQDHSPLMNIGLPLLLLSAAIRSAHSMTY